MKRFTFYNTLGGKLDVLEKNTVKFYSCGPTVYNFIHIGNLWAALVSDLIFRALKSQGIEVQYVRNFTDVDDKIIEQAKLEGTTADVIAAKYIKEVEKDYSAAGMLEPTHKTLVTQHITPIILMIQKLVDRGHAYIAPDGEVLYSIETFANYGCLSRKSLEDLKAGARVEISSKKKHPHDFVLWKPAKPGEPQWLSPWGHGRPGWHIECSAMATQWLGDTIDIHHGGIDLIFPHHENEIAQSEGATGQSPFSKIWIHNEHLTMDKEKMSKSLGNIVTARKFLTQYSGEVARMLFYSAHYRTRLDFSEDALNKAVDALERIYEAKAHAINILAKVGGSLGHPVAESAWGEFVAEVQKSTEDFWNFIRNDLNTPGALGEIFTVVRAFNRMRLDPKNLSTPSMVLGAKAMVEMIHTTAGQVLGIGAREPHAALIEIREIRKRNSANQDRPSEMEIESLIAERLEARKNKDFQKADEIRNGLAARGITLKDSADGTTWTFG